ncbi:MAG: type II secretion system F family protein [Clostridiales bacterium]|nr:type II secretion system F family protein [Clostridiales bacterium]
MSNSENTSARQSRGKGRKGLSAAELSVFCGQVALILEAGLPLYDGMETLAGADAASGNADMYQAASRGVTETGSLYTALKADSRWPDYLVEMVGIGERSGQLDKVMRGLEVYYAREDRIRSSVVSAVTYPLVLGVMLVAIVLILLLFVLPVFRRTLESIGIGDNPLMQVGAVLGWVVMALVALVILGVVAALLLLRTRHRDKVLALAQRCVPALGRLNRKITASRVSSVLSMMLSGGFQTGEALDMTAEVVSDDAAQQVRSIRQKLEEGGTFAGAVAETGLYDELHERMIKMGSAMGHEDQVLGKLGELYEEQVEEDISRLVSIIEPTLVAVLSVVIGAVLLTVMLPMAGILSSL